MEQGVRAHRLQGCDPRRGPAGQRRFRHVGHPPTPPCVWQTVAKTSYGAIGPASSLIRAPAFFYADIGIDANNIRVVRNLRHEYLPPRKDAFAAFAEATSGNAPAISDAQSCDLATTRRTQESAFGLSLLEARGDRTPRWTRRRQVRRHVPQERCDARGRPHAGAASQLPRLDDLHRGRAVRPAVHGRTRHLGLGDGVQPVEPGRGGRAAGRIHDVDTRPVRLLGDRVRVQADSARQGSGRAGENRRPLERAVACLLDRRGRRLLRRRSRRERDGPRQRPARVCEKAPGARPRAVATHRAPRPRTR